jgi:Tfp pilus assembly protein PilF
VAEANLPARPPTKASLAATALPPPLGAQKTDSAVVKQPDSIPEEVRKPHRAPHHQPTGVDPAAVQGAKRELADAYSALMSGRLAQAQSLYEQVDAAGIERGPALTGLAHVAFYRGDYSEAVGLAKRASSAGGSVEAKLVLAMSYFRAGQNDFAIREFRSVLRAEPTNEEARAGLAAAEKRKFDN